MTKFNIIIRKYVPRFMADFKLHPLDAFAVFGNLAHECNGFQTLQETKPVVAGSDGGYGWAMWTGKRRRAYMAWCKKNGMRPADDEANYRYMLVELHMDGAPLRATIKARTLREKVIAFELAYERAGTKHYDSRVAWANKVEKAYYEAFPPKKPVATPLPPVTFPPVVLAPAKPTPEPVTIPGLDKPLPKSKTIWSAISGFAASVIAAFGGLDWRVQMALLAITAGAALWIIYERRRYRDAARKAGV